MANTKRDFYAWVKVAYPGIWAEDMSTVDWTLPYYAAMIKRWKSLGYPTAEGVTAVSPGDEPFISPPEAPGLGTQSLETRNGQRVIVTRDDKGNVISIVPYGPTPEQLAVQQAGFGWRPGEQELEQQQFAFQKEQFEWQKQQAQQQIAQSYEDWRRRLLSELTGPEDWITRWMIEQTPEKYPWAPPVAGANQVDVLENQLDEQTARVQFLLNRAAYSATAGQAMVDGQLMTSEEITALLPSAQTERDATYKLWQQLKTEGVNWSPQPSIEQIAAQSVEGRTPPAPSWLSEFAPGQVAGRPITKEQIATPSGQQLTRLPPSQAAGLGGFAEWAGGRPWKDILAHAEIMQPFTPSGAGNRQWRPVTQGMV